MTDTPKISAMAASAGVLFVGSTIASICNYLFTIAMGRMLPSGDFAEVNALIGLFSICVVFASAAQVYVSRQVAAGVHADDTPLSHRIPDALVLGGVLVAVLAVAAVPLSSLLGISALHIVVLGCSLGLAGFVTVVEGGILGSMLFRVYALLIICTAFIKLALSTGAVYVGYGVLSVLCALMVAQVVTILLGSRYVSLHHIRSAFLSSRHYWFTVISSTLIACATFGDVLVAKSMLSAEEAGAYAALSTMGKIVLFAGSVLPTLIVPYIAQDTSHSSRMRTLTLTLLAAGVISSCALFVVTLWSPTLLYVMFGNRFEMILQFIGLYVVGSALLTTATILTNYFVSVKMWYHIPSVIAGLCVYAVCVVLLPDTFSSLVSAYVLGIGAATACLLFYAFIWKRHH